MRFGSRHEFHFLDLIGDAVKTTWQGRHAIDWSIIARRLVKLTILALTIIAMTYVLYPTQKRGWLLWLGTEQAQLAHWTAVSLVGFTAVIIPGFRYAWEHGHKVLASLATFFAVALLSTVLMGTWNFYSFASSRAVATSLAAAGGAGERIQEATRRLAQIDAEGMATARRYDEELARTPASYASARARILRAQTEARQAATTERTALQAELKEARAQNVTVNQVVADPRPIDQFISNTLRTERTGTGVALDLWRSLVFELAALIGVALSTTAVFGGVAGAARDAQVIYKYGHQPLGDDRAIEDQRTKPSIRKGPYVATKERVFDAETGEELIDVPGYRRRKSKSKPGAPAPAAIETPPISLPDETGVQLERDSRVARPSAAEMTDVEHNENYSDRDSENGAGQAEQIENRVPIHGETSLFGEPVEDLSATESEFQHQDSYDVPFVDVAPEISGSESEQPTTKQELIIRQDDLTDEEWAALADEEELEKA